MNKQYHIITGNLGQQEGANEKIIRGANTHVVPEDIKNTRDIVETIHVEPLEAENIVMPQNIQKTVFSGESIGIYSHEIDPTGNLMLSSIDGFSNDYEALINGNSILINTTPGLAQIANIPYSCMDDNGHQTNATITLEIIA